MIRRAFFIAFVFSLFFPIAALACSCSKDSPGACAGLQKDDVVFTGTVTEIEVLPAAPQAPNPGAESGRGR
jgi:hypothetical protein